MSKRRVPKLRKEKSRKRAKNSKTAQGQEEIEKEMEEEEEEDEEDRCVDNEQQVQEGKDHEGDIDLARKNRKVDDSITIYVLLIMRRRNWGIDGAYLANYACSSK